MHPIHQISFLDDSRQSFVLEASAGTGKTWTVERLFIKAILERPEVDLSAILVVTFTNAATLELKNRILKQLISCLEILQTRVSHSELIYEDTFVIDFLDKRKDYIFHDIMILMRAIQNFDLVSIFTIHAFCNKIIREYQSEFMVSCNFDLIVDDKEIFTILTRNFFRQHIINNPIFASKSQLVFHNLDLLLGCDWENDYITRIVQKLPQDLVYFDNGLVKLKYQVNPKPQLELLMQENSTPNDKIMMLDSLISAVVNYIVANYGLYFKSSDVLTFNDLVKLVADGVIHSSTLLTNLQKDYKIAFIDEFQDTDFLQWQIFSSIFGVPSSEVPSSEVPSSEVPSSEVSSGEVSSGEVSSGEVTPHEIIGDIENVENAAVARATLIVVGDPKQAIYRFRGADIDVYIKARDAIKNTLQLTENRRSHPHILQFVNLLFDQKINPYCFGRDLNYAYIESKVDVADLLQLPRQSELDNLCNQHNFALKFYENPMQVVAILGRTKGERELNLLNAIALEILVLLNINNKLAKHIAILVNRNDQATLLVQHLKQFGINATELNLGSIFATDMALELYQILRAIMNLSNVSYLHSAIATSLFNLPLAGLQDADILQCELIHGENLWQRFYYYHQTLESLGIMSLIYLLIDDIILLHEHKSCANGIPTIGEHGLTYRKLSNLLQLSELLHRYYQTTQNNYELLNWFNNKIKNAVNKKLETDLDGESDEIVRLDNDDSQIVITTQHKAKGLEYDILFCPYFKADDELNSNKYQLPFFANYRVNDVLKSELVSDTQVAQKIIASDNKEIHRLNYVALTRAKARIYVYLKEPTKNKGGNKYHALGKIEKIAELFGCDFDNACYQDHALFNFSEFFVNSGMVLKQPELLTGVSIYQRGDIASNYLKTLQKNMQKATEVANELKFSKFGHNASNLNICYMRQSYSSLVARGNNINNINNNDEIASVHNFDNMAGIDNILITKDLDVLSNNEGSTINKSNATSAFEFLDGTCSDGTCSDGTSSDGTSSDFCYKILNELSGSKFGVFLHELLANYPITHEKIKPILLKYNIDLEHQEDLLTIGNDIFNYPVVDHRQNLASLNYFIAELEFNLKIKNHVNIANKISRIIAKYYGELHPYALASKELKSINYGYLNGFIDLFFEFEAKYYVLDYKTNLLGEYTATSDPLDIENTLVQENAKHHYYLQYFLYLLAIKRYLQFKLNIADATNLLGGAIYYYVRGIFVKNHAYSGVFTDANLCIKVVAELDLII